MARLASTLRTWILGVILLLLFLGGAVYLVALTFGPGAPPAPDIYHFKGVNGPQQVTPPLPARTAAWQQYGEGSPSRLAILLTDPDSAWLGLAHGLKTIGVPFRITRDVETALAHEVVVVYPTI